MNSIVGAIGWHMVGAASAASFYAPIGKVKQWSWETTWAVAGIFSWVLLPIAVSASLLPDFTAFYAGLDSNTVLKAFLFGCMWGVGNVSYGLTMRYLGMALGIGIAIGTTLVVGTLIPPMMHGQFLSLFTTRSGMVTLAGVVVALIGVAVVTYAGHQKEEQLGVGAEQFSLKKGVLLAILCGIFSSGMSFAIDAAKPVETAALQLGVQPLYAALPSYVIIMGGGALVNFAYCILRLALKSDLSFRADCSQPRSVNIRNAAMAATGGTMWYLQFFFYAWGAANVPQHVSYVNWMLHMSGYVLFGALVGLALGEWAKVGKRPIGILWVGVLIIILATNLVGVGMQVDIEPCSEARDHGFMSSLFEDDPRLAAREPLEEGAVILRAYAAGQAAELVGAAGEISRAAPFRHLVTPGGYTMSVAMTNCGRVGWVSDRSGYRYSPDDPETGKPWPAMPGLFLRLAQNAADEAGFRPYDPDACLINRYQAGSKLGLHQDRDENDQWAPIVSVSLGLPATFLWGGKRRGDPARRIRLESGDVVVWGGPARFIYHGVAPLKDGTHPLTGPARINLTFRKVF